MESSGLQLDVAIIDDDDDLIRLLVQEIEGTPGTQVAGVFPDMQAFEQDRDAPPDLIFLDPLVGPEEPETLLGRLAENAWPLLVLVTSDEELAVAAFERRAVDFLLKPPTSERLRRALDRARREAALRREGGDAEVGSLVWESPAARGGGASRTTGDPERPFSGRLMIKEEGRVFFIETEEIRYIRSDGNYVRIYLGESFHLARGTMKRVESHLDPDRFLRIHRSTLVNVEWVEQFRSDNKGRYSVVMEDGTELVLSRSYRDEVLGRAL